MRAVDAAYIAGLFDGEGSIELCRPKARNGKRYPKLRVRIAQNEREVLEWVARTSACGSVQSDHRIYGSQRKIMHRFIVTDRRAEMFLALIRRHLRIKAAKVDALLEALRAYRAISLLRQLA